MYHKIKEHFIEFIIISVIIAGLSYTVTTTYKTAINIEKISKKLENHEKTLQKIKITLATSKLKNKTLSEKDIENLMSNSEFMNDFFKIIAKEGSVNNSASQK